jgi:superfamily II DNA or RNA helicase
VADDLAANLETILTKRPGQSAAELAQLYHAYYQRQIDQNTINKPLQRERLRFRCSPGAPSRWHTIAHPPPAMARPAATAIATPSLPLPDADRELISALESVLTLHSGSQIRDVLAHLTARRVPGVNKARVNGLLYKYTDRFRGEGPQPPRWYTHSAGSPAGAAAVRPTPARSQPRRQPPPPLPTLKEWTARLTLWKWQCRALQAWQARQHRGVIEAVTGTGKTRVGIAAAAWAASHGIRTLIIVPTIDLQTQWYQALLKTKTLSNVSIGRRGDGNEDTIRDCSILITTIQSCYDDPGATVAAKGLLIADECHRYGGERWAKALHSNFSYRLGLTATYERNDDGVKDYLTPYFGGRCYSLDYKEALADDIIAHFKIAFVGVQFTPDEQSDYEEADGLMRWAFGKLVNQYGLPDSPFGTFMKEVNALATDDDDEERGVPVARAFLKAFTARRKTLAEARGKLQRIGALREAIQAASRTIVFTQTKDGAQYAARMLSTQGLATGLLHSDLDRNERSQVMDDFDSGETMVIAAPRLLDEGIDVPTADLAIIVAASRTRLQMIQRMGRVLRKKPDGRLARVVIMYVIGTSEDPQTGAHEAFIDLVTPHAVSAQHFSPTDDATQICAYLNNWHRNDLKET